MLFLAKIIALIPFWVLYPIGNVLSYPLSWVYRRKVVFKNLKKAFPEKDDKEIRQIRNQFYKNLMDIVIEAIKTFSISEANLKKRVVITNPEVLLDEFQNGKSVIIYASHYCNWEWVAHAIYFYGGFRLDPVYKVQSNKAMDSFVYHIRSRFGGQPIPKENAVRNIVKNKGEQRAVGFVADQRPHKTGSKQWVNLLDIETAFFPGNTVIPYITQFPAYYSRIVRVKRGYYEVEMVKIGEPPYQKGDPNVLLRYAEEIEKQLRDDPANWLWTHKRWKYKRSSEEELLS